MQEKKTRFRFTLDEVGDFLAKLSEHSDQVYWISSPDFSKIQYISPSYERIWGRSREQLYANPEIWITFLHPEDVENHHPIHHMAEQIKRLGEKARYSEQYRIIRPNGEIRWIIDKGFPLIDHRGLCYGVTGVATDVTDELKQTEDLKKAKEAAEIANKAKSEFIANMSHDIRTPLSGIVGLSKLLEGEAQTDTEKEYARWINQSGEQLLDLLNNVLELISLENLKELEINREWFSLREELLTICKLELPAIKVKNLEFTVEIEESVPDFIFSDRIKFHQILLNLLGNAIKFTEKGHIILAVRFLSSSEETVELEFCVEDTGIGIADNQQERVFDRFFRIAPSYKGVYKGYGLGLHIVKKYVALLGGEIRLKSMVGKGSIFAFKLSVKSSREDSAKTFFNLNELEEENIPEKAPIPNPKRFSHTKRLKEAAIELPHLLLIEDNTIALRLLESVCKQVGCQFTSTMDAEDAFELVKKNDYDLIITDIGLPGMSGIELTIYIRHWEQALNKKPIPIVGLTAHSLGSSVDECLEAGMNKVFAKPINLPTMQGIVSALIPMNKLESSANLFDEETPLDEEKLFNLTKYPLLDIEQGLDNLGSVDLLKELLTLMVKEDVPDDKAKIQEAFAIKDWPTVEKLALKMKSSALYCGTIRLRYACQYLEGYKKTASTPLLEKLYYQLIQILDATRQAIIDWLQKQNQN
ncbi:PAS domain-containing hybrid sensor histidine kinase/response regulator [Legionella jamestowniensis]|uniref:histidine kinase n=1 Tax=Legionella jamestowniensis TaxID=455 RepID=A0A0W0UZU7_9GAMM|nr:PAS domain-containing hybrid sensor histidine kinase/response regulator [Legionella jamestowniensis]KTD13393.1 sensory box histidine kinase/response regulator [Legionella jamestowniensis]SFL76071.1 PAS domain S-box-containing protein [Legionella jamestowniensis DSM 19215]